MTRKIPLPPPKRIINEDVKIFKWFKNLFHKHEYTNKFFISGHGYTEYEVWFCKSCPKIF